jgi:hypothetical protein
VGPLYSASAFRPASVSRIRVATTCRSPARVVVRSAATRPSRTKSARKSILKPRQHERLHAAIRKASYELECPQPLSSARRRWGLSCEFFRFKEQARAFLSLSQSRFAGSPLRANQLELEAHCPPVSWGPGKASGAFFLFAGMEPACPLLIEAVPGVSACADPGPTNVKYFTFVASRGMLCSHLERQMAKEASLATAPLNRGAVGSGVRMRRRKSAGAMC